MTVYEEISQQVGWDHDSISIPSRAQAEGLTKAAGRGDRFAFTKLMEVCRFHAVPMSQEEINCLQLVIAGFEQMAPFFKQGEEQQELNATCQPCN